MPEDNRYQPYEVLKRADGTLWSSVGEPWASLTRPMTLDCTGQ